MWYGLENNILPFESILMIVMLIESIPFMVLSQKLSAPKSFL